MATASGCYDGVIDNGHVTSACQSYATDGKVYCRYYCHGGYTKTAPNVYCAGNDKWVPVGSYPSDDASACMKDTDFEKGCHSVFFDTGYVAAHTCANTGSGSPEGCQYICYKGYNNVSSTVYCAGNQWLPTGTSPAQNATPCIQAGVSNPTTSMTKLPPPVRTTTRTHTTDTAGYYEDPSLRMDVSPAMFVGALIGGIAIMVAVVFTVFFRAHRKSARDSRVRSLFLVTSNQLRVPTHDGVSNYPNISLEDDSEFRDIARRIMSHAANTANDQQLNSYQPPPYETLSASNNDPSSPPYTAVNLNLPAVSRASNTHPDTFQQSGQSYPNTGNIHDPCSGPVGYDELDTPPPYEWLGYSAIAERDSCVQQNELQPEPETEVTDTPPPYTNHPEC